MLYANDQYNSKHKHCITEDVWRLDLRGSLLDSGSSLIGTLGVLIGAIDSSSDADASSEGGDINERSSFHITVGEFVDGLDDRIGDDGSLTQRGCGL